MKKLHFLLAGIILFAVAGCQQQIDVTYNETAKVDTVDDYFGTKIADPYRWLENDTSAETEAWVIEENCPDPLPGESSGKAGADLGLSQIYCPFPRR